MNGQPRASKPVQTHPIKHVPQRMCVVCRTTAAKRTLTRLVRVVDDSTTDEANSAERYAVQIDPTGKRSGRGAYLCDQSTCWQRASDSDVLAKALRMTLTDADRQLLRTMTPTADSHAHSVDTARNPKPTRMAMVNQP